MAFLLTAERRTPTNRALVAAARELGVEAHFVKPAEVPDRVEAGDTVLLRLDVNRTLDGVEPGVRELGRIGSGIGVLNRPGPLLAAHDKLATAVALARHGIPHPRTAHVGEGGTQVELEPPVVVKPRFGSRGKDVLLCGTRQELVRCLRSVRERQWFRRHGALVQELIPLRGPDMRLVLARGRVVGAVQRAAAPGEWRTSAALGATCRPAAPPPEACVLAGEAARASGCELVGVDLVPLPDGGWAVLDLNAAVELTPDYGLDGADIFERVVDALVGDLVPAVAAA